MVLAQDGVIWVLGLTASVIYVLNICFSKFLIRVKREDFSLQHRVLAKEY